MSVKRIELSDERLVKEAEFEYQIICYESGIMIDNYWRKSLTVKQIIEQLEYRYKNKIDISVWDYEGEIKVMATPSDLRMFPHYYVVIML